MADSDAGADQPQQQPLASDKEAKVKTTVAEKLGGAKKVDDDKQTKKAVDDNVDDDDQEDKKDDDETRRRGRSREQARVLAKVALCRTRFAFEGDQQLQRLAPKEAKRRALLQLLELLKPSGSATQSPPPQFAGQLRAAVLAMFAANAFRVLGPPTLTLGGDCWDPEEDEPTLEASWPHLQLVYQLLLALLDWDLQGSAQGGAGGAGGDAVSPAFLGQLVALFDSEDPREREMLKGALHRLYQQLGGDSRPLVRRLVAQALAEPRHNGTAELLEVLASWVSGFALPLKAEHRQLLLRTLMPLHRGAQLATFHPQLAYCVVQFLEKEPALAGPVIGQLVGPRLWPRTSAAKQVMFLNELEELLDVVEPAHFRRWLAQPRPSALFQRLGRCAASAHFQVAERALYFWNNEYLMSLVADNYRLLVPVCLPYLVAAPSGGGAAEGHHWNKTIVGLVYNALKLLMNLDQRFFDSCLRQLRADREAQQLLASSATTTSTTTH
ncbi:Serine/threonine-protein phosphatase 2A 56 kDa regulatory subunit gamma isoform [Halotydeus destructor]|nr:Serine/threonine-protein phosphatase 2A 56 kDa regulatory subunit gamma isoform [Halotydeus destructor]